eukprot:Gregarina_sp_Pseudo_9__781@NODE_14_length_6322_cov_57_267229_g12_i0_p1_GENE_NODE_14_length_6322_cov_57_267229_g12_i0NODE_14_length_6322_cov_57_267229_g12_i0_p1_ORF_typecomplete_len559_score164_30SET/PF00856_28/3e18SET/PF00856_28/1_3e03_NODE_14_length_6322_cov_57_267229_g12_i046456321
MGREFHCGWRNYKVVIMIASDVVIAPVCTAGVMESLSILNDDGKMSKVWTRVMELENINEAAKIVEEETGVTMPQHSLISGIELRVKDPGNYGLFATREIARGEVVALCKPMACVSDIEIDECFREMGSSSEEGSTHETDERDESESDEYDYPEHAAEVLLTAVLCHQVCEKGETGEKAIESLVSMYPRKWAEVEELNYEPLEDERLIKIVKGELKPEFYEALVSNSTSPANAAFGQELRSMCVDDQIHWLIMKVACNVMACRVESDALDDQQRDEFYAVFHTGHLFNHSCVANAVPTHLGDLMMLRAVRVIQPGEEITFSYVRIDDLRDPMDVRNFPLFECKCERCRDEPEPLKPTYIDDEFTAELLQSVVGEISEELMNKVTVVLKDMVKLQEPFDEPFMTLASVANLPTKMPEKIDCLEALSLLWSSLKEHSNSLWAITLALFMLENEEQRAEIKKRFPQGQALFEYVEKAARLSNCNLAVDDTLIPFQIHLAGVMLKVRPEDEDTIQWALKAAFAQHKLCYGGDARLFEVRHRQQISDFYSGLERYFPMLMMEA